jgi:hypothetical protein
MMKGKRITVIWILFFGLTAVISYLQKDFSHGVILTIPFAYYVVKLLRKIE